MTVEEWLNNDELGINIWKKKYQYNNESLDEWFKRVSGGNLELETIIRNKKFLFGGRTLTNRNTGRNASYSNCYSAGKVVDDLNSILQTAKDIGMTFKSQGGQGLSLSDIRPKGSKLSSGYETDGIIPFMEIYNTITASISQGGSRKGALMMSLSANHPQITEFIKIKSDFGKINNANLSVEVDDSFMKAVKKFYETGEVVTLHIKSKFKGYPDYDIIPIEIYKLMMEHAYKYAEPGIMFMNRFKNYNLMEYIPEYQIDTSNPCGEQPLPKNMSCNLSSINLSEYVKDPFSKYAEIDWTQLLIDLKVIVREMDKIIDENLKNHPLKEQQEQIAKYRNLGIGIMGLHDMFIKLNIKYGSPESINLAGKVSKFIFRNAVINSCSLAKELGTFPGYSDEVFDSKIIKNNFSSEEIEDMRKYGLRNCSLISIAPTGSISTMLGVSGGLEPLFMKKYQRKTVSLNKEEKVYNVYAKIVKEYLTFVPKASIDDDILVTAYDIDPYSRVDLQAELQKHIDTAISSTINLKENVSQEYIEKLYMYAWESGCKGLTIFRENSRPAILGSNLSTSDISKNYSKRPEVLKAKLIRFKNGSESWIAFVGLIDGKPYEIFTGINNMEDFPIPISVTEGEIIKVKDQLGKRYDFQYIDKYGYTNRLGGLSRIFNQEYWNYAKLISALLRGGIELDKVVKIIDGMHFESDTLNTWKNGVKRAIKMFVADGSKSYETCPECGEHLVYEGGCTMCKNCGFSRCG